MLTFSYKFIVSSGKKNYYLNYSNLFKQIYNEENLFGHSILRSNITPQ